jgi:hypothetical protein
VAREDDKVDFSIPGDIVRILVCVWFKWRDKMTVSRVASWQTDNDSPHQKATYQPEHCAEKQKFNIVAGFSASI